MEELKKRHASWCKSLQRAVETDGWGQVIEAVEAYERLAVQLTQELPRFHQLSKEQTRTIEKVAGSLDLRAKCLSSVDGERNSPTKEDMEDILEVLCSVLSDEPQVFPAELGNVGRPAKKVSTVQVVDADAENDADDDLSAAVAHAAMEDDMAAVTTKKTPNAGQRIAGETYLDVKVSKIGLKDASVYTNPTVVVSVFDRDGKAMGEKLETQVGGKGADAQHVSFAATASLQLEASLKDMEGYGAAIFFEFYHYKPKKRKKSCRCWALLEMDEVAKGGARVLELYQKPMDPRRKRINLFTVKELYLHVQLTLQTP